ncbi:MAG: ACP S-malonyltransferase [Bacilli bacterium]|jgi:[acyl-carrier-protein] S-malonyltransferase|nr:ACP S-malonyltransferase [Bacilli bacterium]
MKIGFIFAGQGNQYQGMGQDLYEKYPLVKDYFNKANMILGYDLYNICLNNPDNKLNDTIYTQPALVTLDHCLYKLLEINNIKPHIIAGLSLGEYNALCASDVITFEDMINIIKQRALIMSNAFKKDSTGMAAILKANPHEVEQLLKDNFNNEVAICNYNTDDQVVIGGYKDCLNDAISFLKERGYKRIIPLQVSVVSHMNLLNKASDLLKEELEKYHFNIPKYLFINNINATFQVDNFVPSLARQISCPTKMAQTIKLMLENDIDTFIEIGPKKTISSFIKSIASKQDKEIKIFNVYDDKTLLETINEIGDING